MFGLVTFFFIVLAILFVLLTWEVEIMYREVRHMADILGTLEAQVTELTNEKDSVIALLVGIKAKLDAAIASNDPARLQALSDAIGKDTKDLADAVVANTPAE